MKFATHNSWSYLTPKKWYMKLVRFTARCQDATIEEQYEKYGVRCFDLRIKFDKFNNLNVVHGKVVFNITEDELMNQLLWLNKKKDVYVRVILDVRTEKEYTYNQIRLFKDFCSEIAFLFPFVTFFCGKNNYNKEVVYNFKQCIFYLEFYASVCPPTLIDDWYPRLFAKTHSKYFKEKEFDADFVMVDFVNYYV